MEYFIILRNPAKENMATINQKKNLGIFGAGITLLAMRLACLSISV
jgi:hypothetical protein